MKIIKSLKRGKHTIWHHLGMVVTSEINNLIWFVSGIVIVIAGWVVFEFSVAMFFKLAIGLPLVFVGGSLALMKIYEIVLTIFDVRRIKAMCKYCSRDEGD